MLQVIDYSAFAWGGSCTQVIARNNTITDISAISTLYEFLNEWIMESNMATGRADSNLEDFRVRANQGQCPREYFIRFSRIFYRGIA